ncbi:MAG: ATP-binding protein [Thermoplasmata archaeon]
MILQFIDREYELDGLEERYESEGSDFFIIYGRRRIGKTTLAKEFSKDKPNFYFLSRKQDFSLEVERLRNELAKEHDIYLPETNSLSELFINMVDKISTQEKFVFIIDEFPYWIEENKEILSEMQYIWDEVLSEENIFLVLTGSSIGMMEKEVLDYSSPLYGRRTGQLKVDEIPIMKLSEFLPDYSQEDLIKTYGAIGAVPFYLKEFDPKKGFYDNIQGTFLNKLNILYEEAEILLREELRKPNTYFNIIKSIIDGATKLSEISSKSKISITNINKYLNSLDRLDIIYKEYPVTEKPKQRNFLYKLKDNYFRFWITFVYPNMSQIEVNPDGVIDTVKEDYSHYMGRIFEDVCLKAVKRKYEYNKIGRWWHEENEIDIVALDEKDNQIFLGECKWSKDKVDIGVLKKLERKAAQVRWRNDSREETFGLFSRSGYEKKLIDRSEGRDDIILHQLEDILV